jgi:hypothetical protein
VTDPRPLCLLSVDGIDTWAEGRETATGWETELSIDISGLKVVEKLHIDSIRLHMLTGHTSSGDPVVTTQGNRIDGMRLGNVAVLVTFDDAQLGYACTADRFASYYQGLGRQLGQVGDYYSSTLARDIQLIGSEQDKQGMSVSGNVITWEGFGRVILGEIHVKGHERRLTMVRLAMGSDAGGSGSAGDGQGNGTPVG